MSRITQLESLLIDTQVKNIFLGQLHNILQVQTPEIKLVLDFLYYRYTIGKNKALPGQSLQNIAYVFSNKQKIAYLLIIVFGTYLIRKLEVKYRLGKIQSIYKLMQFIHYLRFLIKGNVIHSLELYAIGFTVVQQTPGITRELDYELLNRTLIWEVINKIFQQILHSSSYLLNAFKQMFFVSSFLGSLQQTDTQCFICQEEIMVMEQNLKCGHSFCYYCLGTSKQCPRCKQEIIN